jgi:hypothetical protein
VQTASISNCKIPDGYFKKGRVKDETKRTKIQRQTTKERSIFQFKKTKKIFFKSENCELTSVTGSTDGNGARKSLVTYLD